MKDLIPRVSRERISNIIEERGIASEVKKKRRQTVGAKRQMGLHDDTGEEWLIEERK